MTAAHDLVAAGRARRARRRRGERLALGTGAALVVASLACGALGIGRHDGTTAAAFLAIGAVVALVVAEAVRSGRDGMELAEVKGELTASYVVLVTLLLVEETTGWVIDEAESDAAAGTFAWMAGITFVLTYCRHRVRDARRVRADAGAE